MKLPILVALALVLVSLPLASAGPETFPVCKDKTVTVPGVTAVYVNFDCYDDIYVCKVGQTHRDCERLKTVTLS